MGGCWDSGWGWRRGSERQMLETVIAWAIHIFETSHLVGVALLPDLPSAGAQLLLFGEFLLLAHSPTVLDSNCCSLENIPFGFWELDVEEPSRSRTQPTPKQRIPLPFCCSNLSISNCRDTSGSSILHWHAGKGWWCTHLSFAM